jgi:hypothetical protein
VPQRLAGAGAAAGRAGQHRAERHDGQRRQQGEGATAIAQTSFEGGARGARLQMGANAPGAPDATVAVGQAVHDLAAVGRSALLEPRQRHPGLVDRLARRDLRGGEGRGDLAVLEAGQLPHDDRAALALGQAANVREQRIQPLTVVPRAVLAGTFGHLGDELLVRPPPADQRNRLVVRDPVQPRLDPPGERLALQRPERGQHRVLERVGRRVAVVQDRAAVPRQRCAIPVEQRLERPLVSDPRERGQALVRHGRQGNDPRQRTRRGIGNRSHTLVIGRDDPLREPDPRPAGSSTRTSPQTRAGSVEISRL